jgi:hypothetical protein
VFLSLPDSIIGNKDAWDGELNNLDHQHLTVFIPNSAADFGDLSIREGTNNIFQIGHGVWTIADFRNDFSRECLPSIKKQSLSVLERKISIIAALTLPDRIPWFAI